MELGKNIDVVYGGAAVAAAANTDNNSSRIDTSDCEGVIFFTTITSILNTGVAKLTIEENDADSDVGMVALSGAVAQKISAADNDLNGKLLIAAVHRPRKRYVQGVRTSATANVAFGEIHAVKYGQRVLPVADNATVGNKATTVSPLEG